jgi:hypothetical protein
LRTTRSKKVKTDQLTHEMALIKRGKFAARREQLHVEQRDQAELAAPWPRVPRQSLGRT